MCGKVNNSEMLVGENRKYERFFSDAFPFLIVFAFSILVGWLSWHVFPDGGLDMRDDILDSLIHWRVPWEEGTPLLPWFTLILFPLRYFSARLATALINAGSVILTAFLLRRYKGNALLTLPITISPVGYWLFSTGQTDALILAGVFLPAGLDLLLFWKPQVIAHSLWVRARGNFATYVFVGSGLFIVSLFLWPGWVNGIFFFGKDRLLDGWWNKSFWPYGIPLGFYFVYLSIKKIDESYGILASPLLFPYVNGPSYLGVLIVIASKWPKVFWMLYSAYWLWVFVALSFPEWNLRFL